MASLNYAEQYQRALANAFPYSLYFGALWSTPNTNRYRFVDAKTIQIPHMTTTGRVDANRDTIATASRNYDNDWETKTLTHQRKWSTLVHPKDIEQTNLVTTITNITQTFNQFQKFPEMDAYLISKVYSDWKALGMTETTMQTGDYPVYSTFRKMMLAMNNKRVPLAGRKFYVTNEILDQLETELFKMRKMTATESAINGGVMSVDGVTVEAVPQELMKTLYNFTEGWTVGTGAKQIDMVLLHPLVILPVISYSFVKLDPPCAMSEGKYDYYEESFEDVFILNKQADGIQFVVEA